MFRKMIMSMGIRAMIRTWSVVGIASAVLISSYSCAWRQDPWDHEIISAKSWQIDSETDPISDIENVIAMLHEARFTKLIEDYELEKKKWLDPSTPLDMLMRDLKRSFASDPVKSLMFRCQQGELEAGVSWNDTPLEDLSSRLKDIMQDDDLLSDTPLEDRVDALVGAGQGLKLVTFRFDTLQPQIETWSLSTNGRMTFVPDALFFMRQAAMHERLAVRTLGNEGQLTAVFDLGGVREVVAKISRVCNIPMDIWGE